MDIHKSMDNLRLISIKHGCPLWIFIVYGYPFQNVLAWISLLGYQCGYPHLYG